MNRGSELGHNCGNACFCASVADIHYSRGRHNKTNTQANKIQVQLKIEIKIPSKELDSRHKQIKKKKIINAVKITKPSKRLVQSSKSRTGCRMRRVLLFGAHLRMGQWVMGIWLGLRFLGLKNAKSLALTCEFIFFYFVCFL